MDGALFLHTSCIQTRHWEQDSALTFNAIQKQYGFKVLRSTFNIIVVVDFVSLTFCQ